MAPLRASASAADPCWRFEEWTGVEGPWRRRSRVGDGSPAQEGEMDPSIAPAPRGPGQFDWGRVRQRAHPNRPASNCSTEDLLRHRAVLASIAMNPTMSVHHRGHWHGRRGLDVAGWAAAMDLDPGKDAPLPLPGQAEIHPAARILGADRAAEHGLPGDRQCRDAAG